MLFISFVIMFVIYNKCTFEHYNKCAQSSYDKRTINSTPDYPSKPP